MMADETVGSRLAAILTLIAAASRCRAGSLPRLVAVSKRKSIDVIREVYASGQRHFGENYVQELLDKATQLRDVCPEIRWHFIGPIQSNKINQIVSTPNLYMVETLASEKHARMLSAGWAKIESETPLKVLVQVNTSGEEQKNGVQPSEVKSLADFIRNNCDSLQLGGFMTIGSLQASTAGDCTNPDFQRLVNVRTVYAKHAGITETDLELSMGMSSDFEAAIVAGSTNVRIGSSIFGARD